MLGDSFSDQSVGMRQVEATGQFDLLMGTSGVEREGSVGRKQLGEDVWQGHMAPLERVVVEGGPQLERCEEGLREDISWGHMAAQEATILEVGPSPGKRRVPTPFVVGLGEVGQRISQISESEESISFGAGGAVNKRGKRCKKCPTTFGMPKFIQLNDKLNEVRAGKKSRGCPKKSKEKEVDNIEEVNLVGGGELEVVLPICPLTPSSGLNFFMEEMGTMVMETPLTGRSESLRKEMDATRLLELEKKAGITFNVLDGEVVKRLVSLEDGDVSKKLVRERNVGDQ